MQVTNINGMMGAREMPMQRASGIMKLVRGTKGVVEAFIAKFLAIVHTVNLFCR